MNKVLCKHKTAAAKWIAAAFCILLAVTVLTGCSLSRLGKGQQYSLKEAGEGTEDTTDGSSFYAGFDADAFAETLSTVLEDLPAYTGQLYVNLNDGVPLFTEEEKVTTEFEMYSSLDTLGRCRTAYANISPVTMPESERESISEIHPTGWRTVYYGDLVEGEVLYNRCHLIAFSLAGENANVCNLITGTRAMNAEAMLPFEISVCRYVEKTGNHVLYRVTPVFTGDNLVADGVVMEAWSVEDDGEGICFCVFCYNEQPGIVIDHATGESWLAEESNAGQD